MTTTNGHVATSAFFARQIAGAGHCPIPVDSGEKRPTTPRWQKLRITLEEVDKYFSNRHNVGLLTGVTGVDCVDKDSAEAVAVADHLMPPTLESSRDESPRSKAFYKVRGGSVPPTKRYKVPKKVEADGKKATVVELLSTGSQAVVTGVHPSGDRYRWEGGVFTPKRSSRWATRSSPRWSSTSPSPLLCCATTRGRATVTTTCSSSRDTCCATFRRNG